jgi:hypothetical protein
MNTHSLISFTIILSILVLMPSCKNETELNRQKLIGSWELSTGIRNGKETESLSGTVFSFGSDNKMETNLPVGIESPADYEISDKEIIQKGRSEIKYKIIELGDSTLTLGLEMRGTEFVMKMKKVIQPL